ncbi:2Fe-2S iron-sulfur cluster-binding protein [Rhodococcus globerulus]|uniref:2Fe-2S iron-sulfur cluster-binding protein n=1 Tax=Rhodococcus globerulus TaxID=33008 RepID=UPI000935593C
MPNATDRAQAVVHILGETHELDWAHNRTLVEVLRARGIDVPYSCLSGECGSCAATVVNGEVRMAKTAILGPEDLDNACPPSSPTHGATFWHVKRGRCLDPSKWSSDFEIDAHPDRRPG